MIKINAMGETCPIPVIKTRNTIKELKNNEKIEVKVDNEIAVQNLKKMAGQMGYKCSHIQNGEREYTVWIDVILDQDTEIMDQKNADQEIPWEVCEIPAAKKKNIVAVLRSKTMGVGEEELGTVLMKGFIFALTQLDEAPDTILLYNSGAFLSCEGSDSVEDLKTLQDRGTEILTCGTCLNYYGITEKLSVGEVTNMYEITSRLTKADLILQP